MTLSAVTAERSERERTEQDWLMHVPVPLFATVMGIGGLGLAWRKAHESLGVPSVFGEAVMALAAVAFVAVAVLYGAKMGRHWGAVRHELNHPVRSNFFPAVSVGLMILAGGALPYSTGLATALWFAGAGLHIVLALYLMGRWIAHSHEFTAFNPAWYIPVVGNILAPLVGVKLGFVEISWFFFSVGLLFWLALLPMLLNRIIFHDMMPTRLVPTLFIFLAPPAVGFLSYVQLMGGTLDGMGRVLFYVALFTTLLLLRLSPLFLKVPFAVSWWAFTFPSAAMATAAVVYHEAVGGAFTLALAWVFLLTATAVITVVTLRTVKALAERTLFVPE